MKNFKQKAFTLAEILIVIAVVGVVSALTIPNLINNYKAKQLRSQFLKSYSTISQALRAMEGDDIPITKDAYPETGSFRMVFIKYLDGATFCKSAMSINYPACATVNSDYSYLDGTKITYNQFMDDGQILLKDGTLLLFEDNNGSLWITADINGVNGKPNKLGYDVFTWELNNHGKLVPMGSTGTSYSGSCVNKNVYGWQCTKRAQSESDYFKWVVKNVK
jgi:prepilin-type N-terminal cleavage/methylation domain-containing protein